MTMREVAGRRFAKTVAGVIAVRESCTVGCSTAFLLQYALTKLKVKEHNKK